MTRRSFHLIDSNTLQTRKFLEKIIIDVVYYNCPLHVMFVIADVASRLLFCLLIVVFITMPTVVHSSSTRKLRASCFRPLGLKSLGAL